MRLICPSCGAMHSAESWMNDADARQCILLATEMPREVSRRCFNYLALFRPGMRGLVWPKTLRLLKELSDLVAAPLISWEKKPSRPNTAMAWGLAMDRVIEHPPKRLPLKSHGYLRAVAWEIADDMDRWNEIKKNDETLRGPVRPVATSSDPERLSVETMQAIRMKSMKAKGQGLKATGKGLRTERRH